MHPDRDVLTVGRLVGLYGVCGWLRVESFTRPRENIFKYAPWLTRDGETWLEHAITEGRPHGKGLVVKLEGIDDRDQATSVLRRDVWVDRTQLPAAAANEFYWSDLIGLAVWNTDGVDFGRVKTLLETGANDVLVIQGERERLVPFVLDSVVTRVDLDARRLEVNWDADF